jgi:hypothetical protein
MPTRAENSMQVKTTSTLTPRERFNGSTTFLVVEPPALSPQPTTT